MRMYMILVGVVLTVACASSAERTKNDVVAGKADLADDIIREWCDTYGWNDDGVCDDFCPDDVDCPSEICGDRLDNDANGSADCDDTACWVVGQCGCERDEFTGGVVCRPELNECTSEDSCDDPACWVVGQCGCERDEFTGGVVCRPEPNECPSEDGCEEVCGRDEFTGGIVCRPVPRECTPENGCFETVECISNADCGPGTTCQGPAAGCSDLWSCEPEPTTCSETIAVFCGCDGEEFRAAVNCPGQPYAHVGYCETSTDES